MAPAPTTKISPRRAAPRDEPRAPIDVDGALVDGVRRGDEEAFVELVARYQGAMLRLARCVVPGSEDAEAVVGEAWTRMLDDLDGFDGRGPFKTWLFRILIGLAADRAARAASGSPAAGRSDGGRREDDRVGPARFVADGEEWARHWSVPPAPWSEPVSRLREPASRRLVRETVATLPAVQRQVITLRDVDGWSAGDVCELLAISEPDQRLLLNRARTTVRGVIATYLEPVRP